MGHEFSDFTTTAIQAEIRSVAAGTFTSRSSPGVSISGIWFASSGNQFHGVLGTVFSSVTYRYSAYLRFVSWESVSSPSTITYWFNSNCSWVQPVADSCTEFTCDSELDDVATEPGDAAASKMFGFFRFSICRFCTKINLFQWRCILPNVSKGLLTDFVFPVHHLCSVRCGLTYYPSSVHYPESGRRRVCHSIKVCIWTGFWTTWHRAQLWNIFPVARPFSRLAQRYKWIWRLWQRFNWPTF